jgi:hypothetical protein
MLSQRGILLSGGGGCSTNSGEDSGQRKRVSGGSNPGVPLNLQMNETRILITLLRMYIARNWEFGSALSKLRNLGAFESQNPPLGTPF